MKQIIYLIMIVSISTLVNCSSMMKKEVEVRPITIKVVDDKTNEPLAGIIVYRAVEAAYGENRMLFGLLPKPEPKIHDRVILTEEGETDNNGIIVFQTKKVLIKKKEILYFENVFINLEPNLDAISEEGKTEWNNDKILILNDIFFVPNPRDEFLTNPNNTYKGVYIFSPEWEISAADFEYDKQQNLKNRYFYKIGISEGILKEEEYIVIRLQRKKNTQ
ncbi:MAG TPA: hypothetical protein PLE64_10785 [Spirochaetota bacterium]|nr:hypothetical protein [Spirochaetota bacterium]HQG43184.1 hypothetical protein [Spirochaetota bacterium]